VEVIVHPRALHIVLSLIAVAGFFLFILACAPSWSPDGSQLVSDYRTSSGEYGVALFDKSTGKATSIYTYPGKPQDKPIISAQWREDGRTVLVFVHNDNGPTGERTFLAEVATSGDLLRTIPLNQNDAYFAPAAEVRGELYLWGDHPIRLNLATGESTEIAEMDNAYLFRSADQILFIAKSEEEYNKDLFFIGSLEAETLQPHTSTEFRVPNRSESEFEGFVPPPATDRGGSRIAFTVDRQDRSNLIVICDQRGLLRTLEPRLDPHSRLGNLQWSEDGNSLYAGILGSVKKATAVWSVAEINAESGHIDHIIPVAKLKSDEGDIDSVFFHFFPVALSPDGHTLATNLAGAPDKAIAESDRALYLVDVKGQWNTLTRIPAPGTKQAAK
jgi:WD40 repeat protein